MSSSDWSLIFHSQAKYNPVKRLFYDFFRDCNNNVLNCETFISPSQIETLEQINGLDYSFLFAPNYVFFLQELLGLIDVRSYILIDLLIVNTEARVFFRSVFLIVLDPQDLNSLGCHESYLNRSDIFLDVNDRPYSELFIYFRYLVETFVIIYQCNYPYHDPMPEDLELDDYRLGLYYGRIAEEEEWIEYDLLHGPPIEYPPLPPPTYTDDDWGNWGLGEGIQVISTVPDFDFSTLSLKSR